MSDLENLLLWQIRALGLPKPKLEHKFHASRKWRFDFAYPEYLLAIEVEGGTWINGRHSRGAGMEADMDKYDEAMRLGWTVYRCSTGMVKSGRAVETITILLNLSKSNVN